MSDRLSTATTSDPTALAKELRLVMQTQCDPSEYAHRLCNQVTGLLFWQSAALSAEASANAMLREAIETYLDAEWGDIIDEPPAEMLAWLELHRPDCKSDIALARALAASPSSLTARVMALEAVAAAAQRIAECGWESKNRSDYFALQDAVAALTPSAAPGETERK